MTACIPDDPAYCFAPVSDADGELPQIRIFVDGLAFSVPTALVALSHADGMTVCDRMNRALGLERAAWTALAARCLRTAEAGSTAIH